MPELTASGLDTGGQIRTVRVAELAERQWGVVGRRQLLALGMPEGVIDDWRSAGRLRPIHPGVYAVGHRALRDEGRLAAALLHAGPGAVLSHLSAGWWWQLIPAPPRWIQISAPGDTGSIPGVRVSHPRQLHRARHRGLPVTPVPRTLLDLASLLPYRQLRRALAEADYRGLVNPNRVVRVLGRGRHGSTALRRALDEHLPELAATRSVLEERFLACCEAVSIPMPEVNAMVSGLMVDAVWRPQRLVVELDGHIAHGGRAATERDRHRELTLRAAGFQVHRYTWHQITAQPRQMIADLRAALAPAPPPIPN